jgi:hypothetical protein
MMYLNEDKNNKYQAVGTIPKSNQNIIETEVNSSPLTHITRYTWPFTFLAWTEALQ